MTHSNKLKILIIAILYCSLVSSTYSEETVINAHRNNENLSNKRQNLKSQKDVRHKFELEAITPAQQQKIDNGQAFLTGFKAN